MLAQLDPATAAAIKAAVDAASGGGTSIVVQYGSFGVIVVVILWVLRIGWPAHRQDMKETQAAFLSELATQRVYDNSRNQLIATEVQNNTAALNRLINGGCATRKEDQHG